MPLPDDIADLLGTSPGDAQLIQALSAVTNLAKAYTRGVGFADGVPNQEIASVIVLATARLLRNPGQLSVREEMGSLVTDFRGGFAGWSIPELATLDRYRVRAQ